MARKAAFTLIELLVVIAIIAILAAILFPVFAQAKGAGKSAACLTQNRQIGTGVMLYGGDYDDMVVPANVGTWPNWDTFQQFDLLLQPYIKSNNVFTCPSADSSGGKSLSMGMNRAAAAWLFFLTTPSPPANTSSYSFSSFEKPADVILMCEVRPSLPNNYNGGTNVGTPYGACLAWLVERGLRAASTTSEPFLRHREGANYVFADGHAKRKKNQQTLFPNVLWTRDTRENTFVNPPEKFADCSKYNNSAFF